MDLCQPGIFCYHLAIKIFNKALIWLNFWLLDIINLLIFNSFLGPGEISFSLNFNRERQTLIVHIREVKDIKLPAGKHSILTLSFIIHADFRCCPSNQNSPLPTPQIPHLSHMCWKISINHLQVTTFHTSIWRHTLFLIIRKPRNARLRYTNWDEKLKVRAQVVESQTGMARKITIENVQDCVRAKNWYRLWKEEPGSH